jgi:hypothetical protein
LRAIIARKAVFHENIFIAKKGDSEFARGDFCLLTRSSFAFECCFVVIVAMKEIAAAQALLACMMLRRVCISTETLGDLRTR